LDGLSNEPPEEPVVRTLQDYYDDVNEFVESFRSRLQSERFDIACELARHGEMESALFSLAWQAHDTGVTLSATERSQLLDLGGELLDPAGLPPEFQSAAPNGA
jgi:hypothetical protein